MFHIDFYNNFERHLTIPFYGISHFRINNKNIKIVSDFIKGITRESIKRTFLLPHDFPYIDIFRNEIHNMFNKYAIIETLDSNFNSYCNKSGLYITESLDVHACCGVNARFTPSAGNIEKESPRVIYDRIIELRNILKERNKPLLNKSTICPPSSCYL